MKLYAKYQGVELDTSHVPENDDIMKYPVVIKAKEGASINKKLRMKLFARIKNEVDPLSRITRPNPRSRIAKLKPIEASPMMIVPNGSKTDRNSYPTEFTYITNITPPKLRPNRETLLKEFSFEAEESVEV
jgi:hypothetical protein